VVVREPTSSLLPWTSMPWKQPESAMMKPITDLWIALIKAPVFGFIIALSGCFQGMLVQGNSEEVGSRTTTAVVQSIFLVIVLDAIFAVFFSSIGWV
jgi:phospholipid/cholesterol/gamma-HCH transport system permease protein